MPAGSSSSSTGSPEIAISPSSFNFFHQYGNSTPPPAQGLDVSYNNPNGNDIEIELEITYLTGSGWVNVPDVDSNNHTEVTVDPTGFSPGNYQAEIRAKMIDVAQGGVLATSDPAIVRLQISDDDFLNITPTVMNFAHNLGQAVPPAQTVQLDTSKNWAASVDTNAYPDVIDITPSSGNDGSGQTVSIVLNSNINNQSVGQLQIPVVFSAGSLTKTLNVTIDIQQPAGGFSVSPDHIIIEWMRGTAIPDPAHINLFSDGQWDVTSQPSWILLSATSGTASDNIEVRIANITSMPAGDYTGVIVFTYNGNDYQVTVNLSIFDFISTDLENGKMYLTHDDHIIRFHTNADEVYLNINMSMRIYDYTGNFQDITESFDLPVFRRKAEFHPGSIVHQLMRLDELEVDGVTMVTSPVRPAEVNIQVYEKDFSGNVLLNAELLALKYYKGRDNRTCLMENPDLGRVYLDYANKFDIMVPFFIDASDFEIKYYGVTDFSHQVNSSSRKRYYFFYKDHTFSQNDIGKVISVEIDGIVVKKYILHPYSEYRTRAKFINSYGMEEWMEFTGRWQIKNSTSKKENSSGHFLYEEKKNVFLKNTATIFLNTGRIFRHELRVLARMMQLPFFWLEIANKLLKVRMLNKEIVTKHYDDGMVSVDLKLEILENTNDTIY